MGYLPMPMANAARLLIVKSDKVRVLLILRAAAALQCLRQ
jgi:hypothetical protein